MYFATKQGTNESYYILLIRTNKLFNAKSCKHANNPYENEPRFYYSKSAVTMFFGGLSDICITSVWLQTQLAKLWLV